MRIFSLHNQHEWIADYIHGRLNPDELDMADAVLLEHPHLIDEYLVQLEKSVIEPDASFIKDKSSLLMNIQPTANINQDTYTRYFVDATEGELSNPELKELETFLAINPRLSKEYLAFSLVKLEPPQVFYPDKERLIKKPAKSVPLFIWYGAAASVMLMIGLWIWTSGYTEGLNRAAYIKKNSQHIHLAEVMPTAAPESPNKPIIPANKSQEVNGKNTSKESHYVHKQRSEEPLMGFVQNQPVRVVTGAEHPADQHLQTQVVILPPNEQYDPYEDAMVYIKPKKKGLWGKIISGEKTYIEDYVNATFGAFKNDPEEDKWVLKVDRDENGKSKRVKFTSPLFSIKSKN